MERYSEYKDSGVQWLGEIPKGWECVQLKRIAKVNPPEKKSFNDDVYVGYAPMERIRCDRMCPSKILVSKLSSGLTYFEEGDIVVAKVTPCFENGNVAIVPELENHCGYGSSELFVYRVKIGNNKRFIFYNFLNRGLIDAGASTMRGTGGLKRVTTEFANNVQIPLPPLLEQHSIVSFLDSKCSKIDEWISKKQKEVELLGEAKQRIIADAVTRGLNPNVKMKKTGIAWLEEVPEHWETRRLKTLFNQRSESYNPNEKLQVLSLLKDVGVIPYSEKGNVGNKAKEDYSSYNVTRKGDIVMNSMNVIIGSVDITAYDGYISPAYYALYSKEGVCTEYYNYVFHMKAVQKHMRSLANGILEIRLRISTTNLFGMYYPVPPLSEQQAIVSYITSKTTKIDSLMSSMNKEIEHLKEYKQRLISDVVTGQIKVC